MGPSRSDFLWQLPVIDQTLSHLPLQDWAQARCPLGHLDCPRLVSHWLGGTCALLIIFEVVVWTEGQPSDLAGPVGVWHLL